MIRFFLFLALVPSIHAFSSSLFASSSSGPTTLEGRIQEMVSQKQPRARLGLSVRLVRNDSVLHDIAGAEWFTPASTMKALTVAAAVDSMPLQWTPQTQLFLEGRLHRRVFSGVLRVKGEGDPNLSARYYSSALAVPELMADSIRALGIDTIQGWLEADESWFQGGNRPKVWRGYFFDSWYGAEISALSFNDNVYQLSVTPGAKAGDAPQVQIRPNVGYVEVVSQAQTVKGRKNKLTHTLDSVRNRVTVTGTIGMRAEPYQVVLPVRKPAQYFLAALRQAIQNRGIVFVADSSQRPSEALAIYAFQGVPLQSIFDEVNQRSQNFHAETLLRNLGALRVGDGSDQGGIHACKLFLRKLRIPEGSFLQVDGSGLSPNNKLKPEAMSLLLSRMARHPYGPIYVNSFGQPGITGNGVRRLSGLEMAHQVRFKTGFIAGVQGLVGYIGTPVGDTLAVALYLNGYSGPDPAARNLMDSIWTWIANSYNQEYHSMIEARKLWNEADSVKGLQARMDYFSQRLLERPYFLGPTGEGFGAPIEPKPRIDLTRFDCVTYLEHVLALAHASTADGVYGILQQIRYENGKVSFETRKHYFVEDWIGKNPRWVKLLRMPQDTVVVREMDKKTFFANKQIVWNAENPRTEIPNLSTARALDLSQNWPGPDQILGVAFMTTLPNLCVFHTGFLIAKQGKPLRFRHASQLKGQTTEQDLGEYLQSKKARIPGLVFFEFLGE